MADNKKIIYTIEVTDKGTYKIRELNAEVSDSSPYGSPNASDAQTPNSGYDYNNTKDLYDRFYEGNEPALDPPGLFDYSKGQYSAVTGNSVIVDDE